MCRFQVLWAGLAKLNCRAKPHRAPSALRLRVVACFLNLEMQLCWGGGWLDKVWLLAKPLRLILQGRVQGFPFGSSWISLAARFVVQVFIIFCKLLY